MVNLNNGKIDMLGRKFPIEFLNDNKFVELMLERNEIMIKHDLDNYGWILDNNFKRDLETYHRNKKYLEECLKRNNSGLYQSFIGKSGDDIEFDESDFPERA